MGLEDYNNGRRDGICWTLEYLKEKNIDIKDIREEDIVRYLDEI